MINDFNEFKMQFPCKIKEHNEINKDFTLAPLAPPAAISVWSLINFSV